MKVVKKDYPFSITIEDKIGKTSGKMYQSISVSYTRVKNKNATDPKEKYETTFINFFDEAELLMLSSLAENAYHELNKQREEERIAKKEAEKLSKGMTPTNIESKPLLDDDIPF